MANKRSRLLGSDNLLTPSGSAPALRLQLLRDRIEAERIEIAKNASRLNALDDIANRHVAVKAAADPVGLSVSTGRSAAEQGRSVLASATKELSEAQAMLRQLTIEVTTIEGGIALLTAALTTEIKSAGETLEASQKELAGLDRTIELGRFGRQLFLRRTPRWKWLGLL